MSYRQNDKKVARRGLIFDDCLGCMRFIMAGLVSYLLSGVKVRRSWWVSVNRGHCALRHFSDAYAIPISASSL